MASSAPGEREEMSGEASGVRAGPRLPFVAAGRGERCSHVRSGGAVAVAALRLDRRGRLLEEEEGADTWGQQRSERRETAARAGAGVRAADRRASSAVKGKRAAKAKRVRRKGRSGHGASWAGAKQRQVRRGPGRMDRCGRKGKRGGAQLGRRAAG